MLFAAERLPGLNPEILLDFLAKQGRETHGCSMLWIDRGAVLMAPEGEGGTTKQQATIVYSELHMSDTDLGCSE